MITNKAKKLAEQLADLPPYAVNRAKRSDVGVELANELLDNCALTLEEFQELTEKIVFPLSIMWVLLTKLGVWKNQKGGLVKDSEAYLVGDPPVKEAEIIVNKKEVKPAEKPKADKK